MRLHLPNQDYRVIINLVGKVDKARTQFRARVCLQTSGEGPATLGEMLL